MSSVGVAGDGVVEVDVVAELMYEIVGIVSVVLSIVVSLPCVFDGGSVGDWVWGKISDASIGSTTSTLMGWPSSRSGSSWSSAGERGGVKCYQQCYSNCQSLHYCQFTAVQDCFYFLQASA